MKTIVLGADHGGFELKNTIKAHLESKGFAVPFKTCAQACEANTG